MCIYYKYAPYGSNIVVLSYFDDFLYWYAFEELGKWFMDTHGKRFRVNFLGYSHFYMSIRISQLNNYSISVDQYRYATAVVSKYLDTATIKENSKFHKTTFPHYMIFAKEDTSTSYEQVEVLFRY